MKTLLLRRHKGSGLGDILGTGMCIVILLTLLTVSIQYMKVLTVKRGIENLARDAILILETTGQLHNVDQLGEQIADMGFHDYAITFNEDNSAKHFGEDISVEIVVRATAAELGPLSVLGLGPSYTFRSRLISICKGEV